MEELESKEGGNILAGRNAFYSNSFLIFVIRFFPSFATLLVTLWYSKRLPVSVYGNYQQFWIQLNILYPLICFGIHALSITYSGGVLIRLAGHIKKWHYRVYALWVVALSTVFAIIEWRISEIPFIVSFLFISAFSFSFILESILIVTRKFKVLVGVSFLFSIGYWAVHYYVLKGGFSVDAVFYYLLSVVLFRLVVYAMAALSSLRKLRQGGEQDPMPAIPEVRLLWLHLGLYDVVQSLSNWIDKFIIALVLSSSSSAIYFNGSMSIPFLPLLLGAAGSAILMQLAAGKKQEGHEGIVALMNQSGRVLSSLVFPAFCYLFMYRQELILSFFGDKFSGSIGVFTLSLLVLPVRAYSFTTVLQRLHKGKIINIGAIAEIILAVLLIYPLYTWIGLPGVALSFVISTYLQAGFYLSWSSKLLGVSMAKLIPIRNWLIKLIVFSTLFIGIHYGLCLFFAGKIALILGGLFMSLVTAVSLWIELRTARAQQVA